MSAGSVPTRTENVLVRVPADKDYVVLIRSAVGHLAALLGCTLDEVTDLRLAVDEACTLVLAAAGPGGSGTDDLECRFGVLPDALEITVSAPAGGLAGPAPGDFGWNILAALVDTVSWTTDDGLLRIDLLKRRASEPDRRR